MEIENCSCISRKMFMLKMAPWCFVREKIRRTMAQSCTTTPVDGKRKFPCKFCWPWLTSSPVFVLFVWFCLFCIIFVSRVDTEDKFYQKYGKFAVRAKLPDPKFDSIWPAHWLMPEPKTSQPPNVCWPVGGEIDIMESWGGDYNNSIKGTFHFAQECGKDLRSGPNGQYPNITGGAAPIDFSQDYHIFSVVWDEERIQWYVDGNFFWERHQNDQPAPHGARIPFFPFYFILNTAISWWSKPPVGPDEPTVYHIIDYVRAYELKQ
eukprot:m.30221 g.30221  ORF g.30221 m.30221 type:complete len:264 (-) comp14514_c0_seq2:286-1077(-)